MPDLAPTAIESLDVKPFAELTRGPVATVYKALDQTTGSVVVLKKVHSYDPERRARFTAEARLAAGVKHPNVVQVLYVTDDSLVAEWVEGADLDDAVDDVGALPPELAVFVARETALGLEAVHQAGILHRDVSAANVLLSLEGEVKLTDFGLASLADDAGDEVRGTLGTMAPEVILGESPTPDADLFSLGAVLVHALTGRAPFAGADASDTFDAVLHHDPAAALVGDPRIPTALAEIAASLLAKEPSSRPSSAAEAADKLTDILEALGSPGPSHLATFLTAPGTYKSPPLPTARPKRIPPPPASLRPALEADRAPAPAPRRSRRAPILIAAALMLSLAAAVYATRDRSQDAPIVSTEEPPAVEPVEVATAFEDDSLLAVAVPDLKDVPTFTPPPADGPSASRPTPDAPPSRPDTPPRPATPPVEEPVIRPAPQRPRVEEQATSSETSVGTLSITSVPWASVTIAGRDLGPTSPESAYILPVGIHQVTLTNDGFPPHTVSVRINSGDRTQITVSLWDTVERLELDVSPWADVYVDGESVGKTPLTRALILAPGAHTLRLVHPSFEPKVIQVRAAAGISRTMRVAMNGE